MKKKFNKSGKVKIIAVILAGFFLFSGSMMVLFDFQPTKKVTGSSIEFIKVKDGVFSFLDAKGYNFKFQCEINQILLEESERIISDKQVIVVSNNSFGRTVFTFDLIGNGKVKFTIDHDGNMIRDYWFRIIVSDLDFELLHDDSVLSWDSGYFDFSDMKQESSFWLDQNNDNYLLSVRFDNYKDFWIDPILSPTRTLTNPVINESANNTDAFATVYQPLFADDGLTDDDYGVTSKTEFFNFSSKTTQSQTGDGYWGGRMKNETDGVYRLTGSSLEAEQFQYNGIWYGSQLISNYMNQTDDTKYPYGNNVSQWQWLTFPMQKQYDFTSVVLKCQLSEEMYNAIGWGTYDYPMNLTGNDYLTVELIENGYTVSSVLLPAYMYEGMDTTVTSTTWNTQSSEQWNFPVVSSVSTVYNFTGTEIVGDWITLDLTDMVDYWNENITFEEFRLGFRFRLSNYVDPLIASWFCMNDTSFTWIYNQPNIIAGGNNPYWYNRGERIIEDFDMMDNHFEWENDKFFETGESTINRYGGGGNHYCYNIKAHDNNNLIGSYTTDGIQINFSKVVGGADSGSTLYSNWVFNRESYGEYSVRFRVNDSWEGTITNAEIELLLNQNDPSLRFRWGWGATAYNDLGVSDADMLNGEWHEITVKVTDTGGFLEPYNDKYALMIFVDGELKWYNGTRDFEPTGSSNYNILDLVEMFSLNLNAYSSTGTSTAGDFVALELDYMSYTPYLQYRLSNDSTTGDYSVESYSYESYFSSNETTRRLFVDNYNDSATNRVAFWKFNEGSGTIIRDSVGTNDGVLQDVSYDSSSFDTEAGWGVDTSNSLASAVIINDSASISFGDGSDDDPFSMFMWIYLDDNDSAMNLAGVYENPFATDYREWNLYISNSMQLAIQLYDESADAYILAGSAVDKFNSNQWYHVGFTYDGAESEDGLNVWINGQNETSIRVENGAYTAIDDQGLDLWIGNLQINEGTNQKNRQFNGTIDHVIIFDAELGASEIALAYTDSPFENLGYYDSDLSNDLSKTYLQTDDGNYIEGEELLRLAFGNYYRRRDEYISSRDSWYSYASEGINLVNYPIMSFDMKLLYSSDYGEFSQVNSSLSNAYITLYNESMYPVLSGAWYESKQKTSNLYLISEDYGFSVINNSWVSIRLDLRNMLQRMTDYPFDPNQEAYPEDLYNYQGSSVFSRIGGIGFSFYWNNLQEYQYYVNKTDLAYSIKIDNLRFLPMQTVGQPPDDIGNDVPLNFYYFPSSNVEWNYDNALIGNRSARLYSQTNGGGAVSRGDVSFDLSKSVGWDQEVNLNTLNYDYLLFWVYPIDTRFGFYNRYIGSGGDKHPIYLYDSSYKLFSATSNYLKMGIEGNYTTESSEFYLDQTVWLAANNWHLISVPLKSFNMRDDASVADGLITWIGFWFLQERNADLGINFLVDGISFVSGDWDYSNLTLNDYSANWDQNYQVNSTIGNQQYKGWSDNWEYFTEPITNTLDQVVDPEDYTLSQFEETSYYPEAGYISDNEGIESTLGYSLDFAKAEADGYRNDLLAWYKFDEGSGTTLIDSSYNSHDGELQDSPVYSSSFNAPANWSLDFIPDDYVNISDHDDFSFGDSNTDSPFSIECWINPDTLSGADRGIASKWVSGDGEWVLYYYNGESSLTLILWDESLSAYIGRRYAFSTTGSWTHFAVTYDGASVSTGINFYINGNSVSTVDYSFGSYEAMENGNTEVRIGRYSGTYFDGKIDEFRIWDRELTATEVSDFDINEPYFSGIISKWKMDTGSGSTVYDVMRAHDGFGNGDYLLDGNIYGNQYNLTGSNNDEIHIAHSDDLSFTDGAGTDLPFSISLMIKFNSIDVSNSAYIFSKRNTDMDDGEYQAYVQSDAIAIRLYEAGSGNKIGRWANFGAGIPYLEVDIWYHLIFTYDGSEARTGLAIYLDGVRVDNTDLSDATYTGMTRTPSQNLTLGHDNGSSLWYGNYRFDEFTIYNSELSSSEVLTRYQEYERNTDWTFGSNVKATITDQETLYGDTITDVVADIHATTWLSTTMNNVQIDWLYWNMIQIKVKNYHATQSQGLFWHNVRANRLGYSGYIENGWVVFTTVSWVISWEGYTTEEGLYMDNSTMWFEWSQTANVVADLEIDWIRFYHVENGFFGQNLDSGNFYTEFYHEDNDNPTFITYDENVKKIGDYSLRYNQTESGAAVEDTRFEFDFNTWVEKVWYEYSETEQWYENDLTSNRLDWNDSTALEFWLMSNESLSGSGDDGLYGQMRVLVSGHTEPMAGTFYLGWYNVTFDNIVSPSYSGTMVADTWYHFVCPFDDADSVTGTFNPSYVNNFYIKLFDGWDSDDNFTSLDGTYTLWIDGVRPINHTYQLVGSSNNFDNSFGTITTINDYTGDSFGYSSERSVFMDHQLKYVLNRNPTVSTFEGYLTNGSNQVVYELNYTILEESLNITMGDYNHKFYIPKTYSFYNVTFGNGTVKTIESGFTITGYNDTHYVVEITVWESGDWEWNFITENACFYLETSPSLFDGLVYNTTSISYNLQLKNGSDYLVGYPVLIEVKAFDETILATDTKTTTTNGWVNSSIIENFVMQSDKRLYLTATSTNESFLGYITTYSLNYQDFDAPTIIQMVFDETIVEKYPFVLTVTIDDDYTEPEDLTVYMSYGFISSGSLPEMAYLEYTAGVYVVQISGQVAETTIYFNVYVEDNMSNSYTSGTFSSDWQEAAPEGSPADGDNGAPSPPAVTPSGDSNLPIILVFLAGGVMVAIIGYAVFRRVTVRTRRVETREVTTGIGGYGKTTERIEEKGG